VVRKTHTYTINTSINFKNQLIEYSRNFSCFCFLDDNLHSDNSFDFLLAFNVKKDLNFTSNPFEELEKFLKINQDWVFGYLSYDLKNNIENLDSQNLDYHNFPKFHFFIPEFIIKVKSETVDFLCNSIHSKKDIDEMFNHICSLDLSKKSIPSVHVKSRISKPEYIDTIKSIKQHLQMGDIYEVNYCQEFYVDNLDLDPFSVFLQLNKMSPSPFASLYRINNHFCMCSSPERYLKKEGKRIFSQPIKGTIKRSSDDTLDLKNQKYLLGSDKDFSENVMIVDLVRNDLSKIATSNSVQVDELATLYSYQDVHHLISTISCDLREDKTFIDVIKATFPMGSMTGAPKIKSMQLIEKYEKTLRGLYSGSIGYINPEKDFDFNVVIRSIFFNTQSNYLSFMVGGAITIESDPEMEYEECLVKAKSIFKLLNK